MMVGTGRNESPFKRSITLGQIPLSGSSSPFKKQRAARTVSDSAATIREDDGAIMSRRPDRLLRSPRDVETYGPRQPSRELTSRGNGQRSVSRELGSRGSAFNMKSPEKVVTSPSGFSISLGTSRLARAINDRQKLADDALGQREGISDESDNNNNASTDDNVFRNPQRLDKNAKFSKNKLNKKMSFKGLVNLASGTGGILGAFRRYAATNSRRGVRHFSMDDDLLMRRTATQPSLRPTWQIVESSSRFNQPGEAIGFFRRMVRRCLNCLFWIQLLSNEEEKQLKTFVDLAKEIEEISFPTGMKEAGLAFDRNYYKANREINLSSEVMKILTLAASARTPEMVQQVMAGLQTLRSFAEYPLHMQQKLAQVAWYQVVPQKKMVIRQGHEAQNFYFVLGGQAIMKAIRTDSCGETYMAIIGRLMKGSSFGEVALLHQTTRECTVQTVTPMQLLVIYRDDFFRIFMSRGVNDGMEPDHITFCRKSVDFLRHWPLDLLLDEDNQDQCLFHFYRRGQVVVEDSSVCDWIYIVKSGTCSVLKQLHRVEPRSPRDLKKEYDEIHVRKPGTLPRLGTAEPLHKIDSRRPYQPKPSLPDLPDIKMPDQTVKAVSELFKSVLATKDDKKMPHVGGGEGERSAKRTRVTFNLETKEGKREDAKSDDSPTILPKIPKPKRFFNPINYDEEILAKMNLSRPSTGRSVATTPPPIPPIHTEGSVGMPGFSKGRLDFFPALSKSHMSSTPALPKLTRPTLRERSKTFTEGEHDSQRPRSRVFRRSNSVLNETSSLGGYHKEESVFVQVGLLKPKDFFGLEMIQFDDEVESEHTKLSLVSRGAELIMISKKFFMRHCNEPTRKWLREKVRPYPSEPSLQSNLQTKTDWELYKNIVLSSYIEEPSDDER